MPETLIETRVAPDGWVEAVAAVGGPQLVVAGPGAGKTEFLVRRAVYLIRQTGVPPEHVLLLSFSRRGAADLRSRVADALERSFTAIPASTFHSFAFRLLEAHGRRLEHWSRLPSLLTGPEQVALVADLLGAEDPAAWPLPFRGLLRTPALAGEVADFVLRCSENLVTPDALARRAEERSDWRALPGFLHRYRAALARRGRIDYGTVQAAAVELLDDPGVAEAVAGQFRYLLVDEYQDTTLAQARLLHGLYSPHRNLTVAGDPYQSIYSFRGAALTNVAEFPAGFPDAAGRPGRRLVLTTSFRVPSEILAAAVRVTAGGGLPGGAGPVVPAPGRGSVETYAFDQQTHEAEWIAAEVQRIHLRDRLPYRRMAVLVRTKRRLLTQLSRALARRGIPHEEPDRRLVDHPAVRVVLDCVRAATTRRPDQVAAIRRLLLGTPASLTLSALRDLERDQARTGEPWAEVIRRLLPGSAPLADLVSDPAWAARQPAAEGFWHLWSNLPHAVEVATSPRRAEDRAAWSSLAQVLERLTERDPRATLADYLQWSEEEDFEATPLLEYARPEEDRLTLATLHQAKGVDFDVVFIADAVDGVFPDLRRRESLLGVRHLSPSLPGDAAAYAAFRLQEEKRLAYTAMCRARARVVWTCTRSAEAEGGLPSRFFAPVAGATTVGAAARPPTASAEPTTPLEAEAWLRRLLADPDQPPPQRLAALGALVGPGTWRARPPEQFAGVLEPGPDHGLVPPGLALSPSRADSYLECPRRYAFERWLQVGAEGSVYAQFGSVIHGVLEEVERRALAAGDEHGTLSHAQAALEARWDPALFGGGPWADAWRRRAGELLERLYERWPSDGRVVAVEHDLEVEVDGVRWRGRADRIEIRSGEPPRLYVVDYKTARNPIGVREAASSVQLGFYLLAAASDRHLAAFGEVQGAEMWFPAAAGARVVTRPFDPGRGDEVRQNMARAAVGIRAEQWDPLPGAHCRSCAVRRVCPAWPEGREAYLS